MSNACEFSLVATIFCILMAGPRLCDSLQATVNSFEFLGWTDTLMPEQIIVKLTTVDNVRLDLNLQHVPHLGVALPVEFMSVDDEGRLVTKAEHIIPSNDVSYYQDAQYKAAIQLTRYWDRTHELFGYNMKGHVIFNDSIYYIDTKTDNVSQSEASYQFLTHLSNKLPVQIISLEGQQINLVLEKPVKGLKCQEHFVANATRDGSGKKKRNGYRRSNQSRKSRNSDEFFIDVLAIVDFYLYSDMKETMKGSFPERIYENFAILFNEVDLLYKNMGTDFTLNIRLNKILILESQEAASFIESVTNRGKLDAVKGLESIRRFLFNNANTYLEESDHVVVFTRFDLFAIVDGAQVDGVIGAAYNEMMCRKDGTSSSIVEQHSNDFRIVLTVAHEIGHSLAAYHDGSNNDCKASDRYIMTPTLGQETPNTELNPFIFSDCSVEYIMNFIDSILQINDDKNCLTNAFPVSGDIPNVNNRLQGLEMSADDQCVGLLGKGSSVCRSIVPAREICTKLWCSLPSNAIYCQSFFPHPGTPCGKKKICRFGKCQADPRGLDVKDSCPFGDPPGPVYQGFTCRQLVDITIMNCYNNAVFSTICCGSCGRDGTHIKGCEFGDKMKGCTQDHCKDEAGVCCKTCHVGDLETPMVEIPSTTLPPTSKKTRRRLSKAKNPVTVAASISRARKIYSELTLVFSCLLYILVF